MREQLWKLIEANPELKRQLNTYAASEPAEAFAELFAQLYLQKYHGAAPIELSKLIEKVLG
jgi:Mlc titration factor MtfA (ptsG expression regulator)